MTTIGVAVHRARSQRVAPRGEGQAVVAVVSAAAPVDGRGVSARARTRLTRRGRVVLAVLMVVPMLVIGGVVAANGAAVAGTNSSASDSFHHVTVQPGESLWVIARRIAPHADPRDVVGAILDLNGLSTSVVQAGQRLAIPSQFDGSSR